MTSLRAGLDDSTVTEKNEQRKRTCGFQTMQSDWVIVRNNVMMKMGVNGQILRDARCNVEMLAAYVFR